MKQLMWMLQILYSLILFQSLQLTRLLQHLRIALNQLRKTEIHLRQMLVALEKLSFAQINWTVRLTGS